MKTTKTTMKGQTVHRLLLSAAVVVLAGCGGTEDPGDDRSRGVGKADTTWEQLTCEEMDCEYGCQVVLACGGEGPCFEVPMCTSITEALCKDVTCPEGTHCTAYKHYCWESDCPREIVECAPGAGNTPNNACHCDELCSLPQYNDCCSDCTNSGGGSPGGGSGYGTTGLQPCNGLCWYGAKCTDYCPPAASCQMKFEAGQSYWQVYGCPYN